MPVSYTHLDVYKRQVLKDAIERSYQKVGWDLRNSESEKGVFPTFFDITSVDWYTRYLPTLR